MRGGPSLKPFAESSANVFRPMLDSALALLAAMQSGSPRSNSSCVAANRPQQPS
eukprot:CAMPEP_0206471158 /NCGR_PEP_ID=MMETSP0324_2-20121206/31382_1 /ASSEMBLY_ACC=CAM_ASM_000836 /TAXON_ID=2866 /ORGANISM="Crypthecodinium cohnii, Strain Seligo" /LENGTH=53 /DNA_ID=CAMNT_0053945401 /DNA_START=16 /DNA_END=177 /DNA_ORIENTATION=-